MLTAKLPPSNNPLALLLLIFMTSLAISKPVLPLDGLESLKWHVFTSAEGKVKMKFPAAYKIDVSPGDGHSTTKIATVVGQVNYFLSYTIHETPMDSHYEMAKLSLEVFTERLGTRNLYERDYIYKSHTGRMAEMMLDEEDVRIYYRAILVGQIQYQLIVTMPGDATDTGSVDQFFKSFKLMK